MVETVRQNIVEPPTPWVYAASIEYWCDLRPDMRVWNKICKNVCITFESLIVCSWFYKSNCLSEPFEGNLFHAWGFHYPGLHFCD